MRKVSHYVCGWCLFSSPSKRVVEDHECAVHLHIAARDRARWRELLDAVDGAGRTAIESGGAGASAAYAAASKNLLDFERERGIPGEAGALAWKNQDHGRRAADDV